MSKTLLFQRGSKGGRVREKERERKGVKGRESESESESVRREYGKILFDPQHVV